MADPYLLPIKTAALVFPLVALLLFLPVAVVMYRRHGVMTQSRALSFYSLVYYLVTAFCLTIVPLPARTVDVCVRYAGLAHPQLALGNSVGDVWKEAHHRVTFDALVLHNPAVWQAGFNLLLLVPLGMYARYHFRLGFWPAAGAGFAVSLCFELTQLTGVWGSYPCPYRLFDVDDLAVNTAGALVGWAVAGPLIRRLPTLDALSDRTLARNPVPFGRRLVAWLVDVAGLTVMTGVAGLAGLAFLGREGLPAVPVIAFLGWFVVVPWMIGATPGKRLLLLRLTTTGGGRPALWRLLVRAVVLAVPFLPIAAVALVTAATLGSALLSPFDLFAAARDVTPAGVAHRSLDAVVPALMIGVGPALLAGYALAARLHPASLGVHEILSGVRNQALPHRRLQQAAGRAQHPRPVRHGRQLVAARWE
jgi:glycopeptide antibiotics resistance protein